MAWRRFEGLTRTRRWLLLVFLVGWMHAGAYAMLVPLWQAPDEPGHYEVACLLSQVKRPLTGDDLSLSLQRDILANLAKHEFWTQVRAPWPAPLPLAFADDPFLARSGRQAGDEPPLYYLLPALICRTGLPIEAQLRLIRLFGALLFGLNGAVAAWGLRGESRKIGEHLEGAGLPAPPVYQSTNLPFLPFLPLLLVLLPMPAFIAGSVNNDALAMLTATTVFAAVLRAQRLGLTWRRSAGIALLMVLALASKKTNSFLLLWLTILGLAVGWRELARRGWRRWAIAGATVCAGLTAVLLLLPSQTPASWRSAGLPGVVRRLKPDDPSAAAAPVTRVVLVADRSTRSYQRLFQTIEGQQVIQLRGQTVRATAWVRSPDGRPGAGRLTLRDTAGFSQVSFISNDEWQPVTITRTVALTTTHVKLAIAPGAGQSTEEVGRLLVAGMALSPEPVSENTVNLLRNGDFVRPARWSELLVTAPLEERWQQFAPRLQVWDEMTFGALRRYGLYTLLTFAGFWGNFGWLQRPLPVWVYAVLAAICLVAAAGLVRFLRRQPRDTPGVFRGIVKSWLLAVVLIVGQAFLPMLGRTWQPQGRYLFPALLPIAGLLVIGLDAWLNLSARPYRWLLLLGGLAAFDLVCLLRAAHVI